MTWHQERQMMSKNTHTPHTQLGRCQRREWFPGYWAGSPCRKLGLLPSSGSVWHSLPFLSTVQSSSESVWSSGPVRSKMGEKVESTKEWRLSDLRHHQWLMPQCTLSLSLSLPKEPHPFMSILWANKGEFVNFLYLLGKSLNPGEHHWEWKQMFRFLHHTWSKKTKQNKLPQVSAQCWCIYCLYWLFALIKKTAPSQATFRNTVTLKLINYKVKKIIYIGINTSNPEINEKV